MLLNKAKLFEGIFFPLFLFYACSESQKPDSYVARVNDSYLTEEKLSELVDSQYVTSANRTLAIKNWVKQEMLFQEAKKQGILKEKSFKNTIEKSERQLANAMVLENFMKNWIPEVTEENLNYYFEENKSSFKLAFDSYLLNKISFSEEDVAVQFRTELISSDWKSAANKFSEHSSLAEVSDTVLVAEQDIYPVKILRVLEGLYPPEISIVISDDRGYYWVVQLIDKYPAQSIPPFKTIKKEVERRFVSVSGEVAIENFIGELYSKNEIEINN